MSSPNAESENSLAVCSGKDATSTVIQNSSEPSSSDCNDIKPIKIENNLDAVENSSTSSAQPVVSNECKKSTNKVENVAEKTKRKAGQNENKKREDLTSLGSDDSGKFCLL